MRKSEFTGLSIRKTTHAIIQRLAKIERRSLAETVAIACEQRLKLLTGATRAPKASETAGGDDV